MGDADEFLEAIKASIGYGLSNKTAIVIYGMVYLVVLAFFLVGMLIAVFFYRSLAAWALFALTLVPVLVVSVLTMGYWIQCLRALLGGSGAMPGILDDVPGLVIEGVKSSAILIELFLPIMAIYLAAVGLLFAGIRYHIIFLPIGLLLIAAALLLSPPLTFIGFIQQAVYADTGSLARGLNPLEAVRLIRLDGRGALVAAGEAFIIYIIYYVITTVLSWLCVTYILVPFLIIPMTGAILYVIARFYRRTKERATGP